jgi:DNA-binding Lrp family transcriptional regulator
MATPNLLRTINETRVLNLLFQRGPHSRADIARELQVTRSTASALVAGLVERGLLLETEETADVERIGRPGFVVKLNPGARTFIGVDVAVSELRIVALDMNADVIASLTVPYTDPATPDYVVGLVRPAVEKLLADNGLEFAAVEGLGVAIPGLVETDGVIVFAPILNWRNVDIKDMIEQAFDVPINLYFDNDANACAVSEGYRAESGAAGTLAYF